MWVGTVHVQRSLLDVPFRMLILQIFLNVVCIDLWLCLLFCPFFLMQSMLYRHFVKCTNLCSCSLGHFVSAYYYALLSCSFDWYPRLFYCVVFKQINKWWWWWWWWWTYWRPSETFAAVHIRDYQSLPFWTRWPFRERLIARETCQLHDYLVSFLWVTAWELVHLVRRTSTWVA